MSGSVFDRDRRIRSASLTMGQTFYLCTLNQFVGNNDDAWPSQTTLANAMNAGQRSVRKWQKELESMGVLEVKVGKGCQQTNRYSLNLEMLPANAASNTPLNEALPAPLDNMNAAPQASPMRHHVPVNAATPAYRKNKKDQKKKQSQFLSDSFDRFWDAYAKKVGRKKSEIAFARAVKSISSEKQICAKHAADLIVENAGRYAVGYLDNNRFQKNPLTWLHGEHWNDEPPNCTTSDFAQVHSAILTAYTPDVRNSEDVERLLTPEQAQAAKRVGIDRIYRSKVDDRGLATAYAEARRAGA